MTTDHDLLAKIDAIKPYALLVTFAYNQEVEDFEKESLIKALRAVVEINYEDWNAYKSEEWKEGWNEALIVAKAVIAKELG